MRLILIILGLAFLGFNCSSDDDTNPTPPINFEEGFIRLGPDDCDYLIEIENISYKPNRLDSAFQVANLKVSGSYRKPGAFFTCGLKDLSYEKINLVKIERP